ncbi:cytochrome c5 family protein [Halomonas aquamarina]|uniref:Cytochrome c5 family protein n=1 Tax=Vreelandella aquamarina TaxID=77097 RepID=A0ACC5VVB1_9GAMM|nr:c-type cytochrome [Halomonas aquamarina]MBZ5487464.1 cytochrome c5 family protein [Halomonas aquamarina]
MNFKRVLGGMAALGLFATMAQADGDAEHDALAERLAPVGTLCFEGQTCQRSVAQQAASETRDEPDDAPEQGEQATGLDGEALYARASCGACHQAGIAGAPATGDHDAWAARLAKGTDALYTSAIKGLGAMPPKGGRFNFSDDEIRAAVDYMISEVE